MSRADEQVSLGVVAGVTAHHVAAEGGLALGHVHRVHPLAARRGLAQDGRLELARAGGATDVLASPVAEALDGVRAANGGVRAVVVIDATGRAATFAEALPLVADVGRLVIVGDTGDPSGQHLTSDVIARGVSIVGAHGNYIPYMLGLQGAAAREGRAEEQVAAERTLGWRALAATLFDLVRQGRFPLDGTISHTVPATDAAEGYRLVTEQREQTMGVSFAW